MACSFNAQARDVFKLLRRNWQNSRHARQIEFVPPFQPIVLGALQPLIAFRVQFLVFRAADLVHRFAQVLRDVELVENHLLLGLGQMGANRLHVGVPHVQGHSGNPVPLLLRQRRPKAVQARLLAVLRHVQDAARVPGR